MKSFSISAIFKGVDKISEPIKKIGSSISSIQSPVASTNKALSKIGESASFKRLNLSAAQFKGSLNDLNEKVGGFGEVLGLVGGSLTLAGAKEKFDEVAEKAAEIHMWTNKLGLNATEFQKLGYAAAGVGVDLEGVGDGLQTLQESMIDALTGAEDHKKMYKSLGISLKDNKGKTKDVIQVFKELSDKLQKVSDPATRTTFILRMFGDEASKLYNVMGEGSKGLEELGKQAEDLGLIMNDDAMTGAKNWARANRGLSNALAAVSAAVGTSLMPVLIPYIDKLSEWIVNNKALASTIAVSVTGLGMLVTVVSAVGLLWGPAAAGVKLFASSLGFVTNGIRVMTAAALSNPIILIAAGIAAAAYMIWDNWSPISKYFSDMFSGINAAFDEGFVNGIIKVFEEFNPLKLTIDLWGGVLDYLFGFDLSGAGKQIVGSLTAGISSGFGELYSVVQSGLNAINPFADGGGTLAIAGAPGAPVPSLSQRANERIAQGPASVAPQINSQNNVVVNLENTQNGLVVKSVDGSGPTSTQINQSNVGARKLTN
ncbi:phage tail tape measure protein [Novispirillum itersonii]|uniref:phage tail tape measure protein n=1 Tax=Novispirillum itersonii TaxID=189 RepID=UPI00037F06AE|nr:phage tail tape measure protein [Novispirillum itersonii]